MIAILCALLMIPSPQGMNFVLEGKITKSSPGKLVVSTHENIVFHVRYDEKTEIKRQDGGEGSSKELRPGVIVKVDGELTESGEVVAHKIELRSGPSSRQKSSAEVHGPGNSSLRPLPFSSACR